MTDLRRCQGCGADIDAGALFCPRCGIDVTGSQDLEATTLVAATTGGTPTSEGLRSTMRQMLREATLGEYEILSELGRGGMATVFLAHDIALDRKVAIKVMAPHLLQGEGMAERFKLEARTAAQLSHPHIIPIYAVKETHSTLFFVMKFVEGRALDEIIKKSTGPLPIPMVVELLVKVGAALGYAHRRGVVHRDVKPGNIMIDEEGTPIVTDFGIAKVAEKTGLTVTGTTIGTPSYMSPEQCEAKEVTGASDQYSLGIVAFEMLTGRVPFEGDSAVTTMYKHVHDPLPPLEDFRPDCPADVVETVIRMTAKDPADRWPSLEAAIQKLSTGGTDTGLDPVRKELLELVKEGDREQILAHLTGPSTQPRPTAQRSRGRLVAAIALVAAIGGGTLAVMQPWAEQTPAEALPASPPGAASSEPDVQPGSRTPPGGSDVAATDAAPLEPEGGATSDDGVSDPAPVTDQRAAADGSPPAAPPSGPPAVEVVRVLGVPSRMEPGEEAVLTASALDASGSPVTAPPIRWSSSDDGVAVVDPGSGRLRAVAPGQVSVTASAAGVSSTETLTVSEPAVASLTVGPGSLSLTVGERATLAAEPLSRDGTPLAGRSVSWSSDDENVARVSTTGEVTAVGPGRTRVSASSEGVTATADVSVSVAPRTAIEELIAAYSEALEARDLDAVQRAYPGLTAAQREQLSGALQFMENLRADLTVESVDVRGDAATATVSGTYRFVSDGRQEETPVSFEAVFERVGNTWRMTRTR